MREEQFGVITNTTRTIDGRNCVMTTLREKTFVFLLLTVWEIRFDSVKYDALTVEFDRDVTEEPNEPVNSKVGFLARRRVADLKC